MRMRVRTLLEPVRGHVAEVILGVLVVGTLYSGAVQVDLFIIGLPPVLGPVLFASAVFIAVLQIGRQANRIPLPATMMLCACLWLSYVTWTVLSSTWSVYTDISRDKAVALVGYSTLFFVMGILLGRLPWSMTSFRISVVSLGCATVIATAFMALKGRTELGAMLRQHGAIRTFAESYQATTLCLGVAATFALIGALGTKRIYSSVPWVVLWAGLSFAMLAGGGRSAAVGCTIAQLSVVALALALRDVGQNKRLAWGILVLLPIIGVLAVLLAMQLQLRTVERFLSLVGTSTDSSGRGILFHLAVDMAEKNPIFGAGLGTYEASANPVVSPGMYPHNTILEVFAETGLIGLVLFLSAVIAPCFAVLRRISALDFKSSALWLGLLVVTTVGSATSGTVTDRFLVFVLGLSAGLLMRLASSAEQNRPRMLT